LRQLIDRAKYLTSKTSFLFVNLKRVSIILCGKTVSVLKILICLCMSKKKLEETTVPKKSPKQSSSKQVQTAEGYRRVKEKERAKGKEQVKGKAKSTPST